MKWLINKAFLMPSVEQLLSRQTDSWTSKTMPPLKKIISPFLITFYFLPIFLWSLDVMKTSFQISSSIESKRDSDMK